MNRTRESRLELDKSRRNDRDPPLQIKILYLLLRENSPVFIDGVHGDRTPDWKRLFSLMSVYKLMSLIF